MKTTYLLRPIPFSKLIALWSFFLSGALWYTYKIDRMDAGGILALPGYQLLTAWDILPILGMAIFLNGMFSLLVPWLAKQSWDRKPGKGYRFFSLALAAMVLWQIPFLLAFYPAPGMNDTLFMMNNPLYGSVQFPWLYCLIYGQGASWGREIWGSAEPVVFVLALIQLLLYSGVLTTFCYWIKNHYHVYAGMGLYLFFTFWPMVGNYGIAAVRDGLFSVSLLLWVWLFLLFHENPSWNRSRYILLLAALLGTMLLRNNGMLVSFILCLVLIYRYGNRKVWLLLFCSICLTVLPGKIIQSQHHWEPLFQESMAIPLQQLGRTLVMEGTMSEETKDMMRSLLPEEIWKKKYLPYTVDFVKWHDNFRRNELNQEKGKFLRLWLETGLSNPRLYVEGWLTETYALWNLDPWEYGVQSRFGWALSDENTKQMTPADNDRMAAGSFPMPMKWKSLLACYQWENSHFLGSGFCLWLTLFAALLFRMQKKHLLLPLLPFLLNTLTLLLSTPASSVYRYSFAYVLGLPVVLILALIREQ